MSKAIRGIVVEGLPCAGKSAVIAELKRLHLELLDGERSMLALSNRYTAAPPRKHGKKPVKRKKHLAMLETRLRLLSDLAPSAAGRCALIVSTAVPTSFALSSASKALTT